MAELAEIMRMLSEFKTDMNKQLNELKTDLNKQFREFKTEIRTEINEIRTELKADHEKYGNEISKRLNGFSIDNVEQISENNADDNKPLNELKQIKIEEDVEHGDSNNNQFIKEIAVSSYREGTCWVLKETPEAVLLHANVHDPNKLDLNMTTSANAHVKIIQLQTVSNNKNNDSQTSYRIFNDNNQIKFNDGINCINRRKYKLRNSYYRKYNICSRYAENVHVGDNKGKSASRILYRHAEKKLVCKRYTKFRVMNNLPMHRKRHKRNKFKFSSPISSMFEDTTWTGGTERYTNAS